MAELYLDSIMEQLPLLDVQKLESLCGQFGVVVPDNKKGKKGVMVSLMGKYLASDELDNIPDNIPGL